MKTQYDKLEKLISRKTGATAMEIIQAIGTTCPHKRLSDLAKNRGWKIRREAVKGHSYGRYYGTPPKDQTKYFEPKVLAASGWF